jgi:hypothetical protein
MQATAYAEMFEEITGKAIETIVVAISVQSESPQLFVEKKSKYLLPLNEYNERYQR